MIAMRERGAVLAVVAVVAALASAGSARATVTIGTTLAWPADEINPGCSVACTVVNPTLPAADIAPDGLTSPVNGTVTSWRFKSVTAGDVVNLRVLRPAGETSFTGAGTSAPATSDGGALPHGPFATSLPIRIGDHLGLNGSPSSTVLADTPVSQLYWNAPTLADGQTLSGTTPPAAGREVMVQAVVEPTNALIFGKVVRNTRKGTATLTVRVPNAGTLDFSGVGIKIAETAVAKTVTAAGPLEFRIKAKGKKRKTLEATGKVKVRPKFTFTPANGAPAISSTKFKLRQRL